MRRREFLVASSMSAVALPLASRANAARASATPGATTIASGAEGASVLDVHAVVYEARYLAACEFAQRQAERGARVFDTEGCMVSLWRGPLAELVNRGEARVAGLTTYSDFSIARECARDRGLRVLHETWCRDTPVALVHWLIGT